MKRNDIVKKIPDYLTLFRLILAPIIIILGFTKHFIPIIILIIIAAITDFLDGYLAKKWLVQSKKWQKLDVTISKVFIISILLSLALKFHILFLPLILEIVIGISNLYYFNKTNSYKVLEIGKIKSVLLFATIIIAFGCIYKLPTFFLKAIGYSSINLQILTLISYYINYKNILFEKEEKENQKNRDKRTTDLEDKTIMLDKIEDLLKDYEKNDIL